MRLYPKPELQKPEFVKSISYSQDEILKWIIQLYCPNGFDLDPTYSKGVFYKNIPEPRLKFDLNPQIEGVQQANCTDLPVESGSLQSIVFDPPFVAADPCLPFVPTHAIRRISQHQVHAPRLQQREHVAAIAVVQSDAVLAGARLATTPKAIR